MGFGRALVRILGFYAGAGQKGRIRLDIGQSIRILGWSCWPKRSDLAGQWSEHSDFGLGLAKMIRFGWDWSKWSDLAGHWSEYSDFALGLIKRVGFG